MPSLSPWIGRRGAARQAGHAGREQVIASGDKAAGHRRVKAHRRLSATRSGGASLAEWISWRAQGHQSFAGEPVVATGSAGRRSPGACGCLLRRVSRPMLPGGSCQRQIAESARLRLWICWSDSRSRLASYVRAHRRRHQQLRRHQSLESVHYLSPLWVRCMSSTRVTDPAQTVGTAAGPAGPGVARLTGDKPSYCPPLPARRPHQVSVVKITGC